MKLLITGGLGFIGSNFVHYWTKHHGDDEVVVVDKVTYAGNLINLDSIKDRITLVRADICDGERMAEALKGIECVVHFAAETHVDRSIDGPDVFIQSNIVGTHTLLKAARAAGVRRFHHVSTDEVYGHIPLDSDEVWTEETPYHPRSPYSASKAASDHLVRAHFYTYGLPVTITNCANNIGPYMYPEKLIPLAITNILEHKKVPVYGAGDQIREWLYVEDHCRAIDAILHKGTLGETYFVGPNNPHLSNLVVVRLLLSLMGYGEEMIEFVKDRPGHDQKYALSHAKITRALGWEPLYSLEEALKKTIDWYRANEAWWKPIKSGEFVDYYAKQYITR